MNTYVVMSPYENERMNPYMIKAKNSKDAIIKYKPLAYEIKRVSKQALSNLLYSVGIFDGYETTKYGYKKIKIKNNKLWHYEIIELF